MDLSRGEDGYWLSEEQQDLIHRMVRTDPIVRACRDRLSQAILSGGIHYDERQGKKTSSLFRQELDEHWVPYAQHLFDDLFMYGFSVLSVQTKKMLVNGEYRRVRYPVCVPHDTYRTFLKRSRRSHVLTWHCYPQDNSIGGSVPTEDKTVRYLLSSNEWLPTQSGKIHTPVSTLVSSFQTLQSLTHYALVAESIRSNPQLVTHKIKNDRVLEETAMLYEEFSLADGEAFHQAEQERQTERQAMTVRMQQDLTDRLNAGGARHATLVDKMTGKRLPRFSTGFERNSYQLPEGVTTAGHVPTATCRTDLIEFERMHQERICAVLGVPRVIVMSEHRAGSSNASDNANLTFRRTVDAMKADLVRLMNVVYNTVYTVPNGQLSLPGTPLAAPSTIQHLYDQGVINKKTQAQYLMRAAGASEIDIDEKRLQTFDDLFLLRHQASMTGVRMNNVQVAAATTAERRKRKNETGGVMNTGDVLDSEHFEGKRLKVGVEQRPQM